MANTADLKTRALIPSPIQKVMQALFQATPETVLLTGHPDVYRFSLRCAAMIARIRRVVYLDGANIFDPYAVARYAEARGLPEETLLRSVFVRRAFTCYQMYEMVARLPADRLRSGRSVLIVAGPCVTFFDESVTDHRATQLFRGMIYRLDALRQAGVPMLIAQPKESRPVGRGYLMKQLRRLGTRSGFAHPLR